MPVFGTLKINEIPMTDPTEALRVARDNNFDADVNITGSLTVSGDIKPFYCAGKASLTGVIVSNVGKVGFTVIKTGSKQYQITMDLAHSSEADYSILLTVMLLLLLTTGVE